MFGPQYRLGLWLHASGVEASLVRRRRRGWTEDAVQRIEESDLLEAQGRRAKLASTLSKCVSKLPRIARRADLSVAVALSDALVAEDVIKFADFPDAVAERAALVRHRVAREFGVPAEAIAVSHEVAAREADGVIVRARAMEAALRDDIEAAAAAAGLRPTRIDGWSGYASAAPDCASRASGAALWADGEGWTLLCWSPDDPAGFVQHGPSDDDAAVDILRLVRSYGRAQSDAGEGLTVGAPQALTERLTSLAKAQGLKIETFGADGISGGRAARVAAWA